MLALGWTVGPATDTNALIGIFDLNTNTLGPRVQLAGGADPTDIAADVSVDHFTGQFFAAAYANATEGSVNGEAFGLGRVFTSTGGSNTMLATFMADRFLSTKSANDTVSYDDAGTGIAVSLLKNTVGQGGALLDTFVGVENLTGSDFADRITGSNLANVLRGGVGSDVLKGLKGNDVLDGGTGGDTLSGSKGRDTFVFNDGGDLITDFNFRKDSLDIDDALWTGTRSENQVVNRFADVVGNHVVLDFGNGDFAGLHPGEKNVDGLRGDGIALGGHNQWLSPFVISASKPLISCSNWRMSALISARVRSP
jgi:Ca2+-binding RTX toxin-like protein